MFESTMHPNPKNRSLFIFPETFCVRAVIKRIVNNQTFDYIILVFILISSVNLAIENPLNNPSGVLVEILYYGDLVLSSIFMIEAALKIIANGLLFNGPKSYLRDTWNIIDFVIVVFSVRIWFDFCVDC